MTRVLVDITRARLGEPAVQIQAGDARLEAGDAWQLADDLRAAADVVYQLEAAADQRAAVPSPTVECETCDDTGQVTNGITGEQQPCGSLNHQHRRGQPMPPAEVDEATVERIRAERAKAAPRIVEVPFA